jgi:methylglyoxal synthase
VAVRAGSGRGGPPRVELSWACNTPVTTGGYVWLRTAAHPPWLLEDLTNTTPTPKTLALVAHDNCKADLVEWAEFNRPTLSEHRLVATGTTGNILEHELGLHVTRLQSGPLGGDLQIGALITEGAIDMLVFFWDPLESQPHDPDVKALLRVSAVWNIPVACNRATADFLMSSPLLSGAYERRRPDYAQHHRRLRPAS